MHCRICDREVEQLTEDGVCDKCDDASIGLFEDDEQELNYEDVVILGITIILEDDYE